MIKKINYLFVTFFGIGTVRYAPGTITSLITVIFLYSLFHIINISSYIILFFLLIIFMYSFIAVSDYIKESDLKDPKEVVIDEVIGQSIPIYLYEISHIEKNDQEAIFFTFIFLFYLDFSTLKNLFLLIYSIKNSRIALV